ncbi:MAG: NAD(P)/FAD-dependent oxidoreductase [Candidatus Binatia bacterium]|nr:NAD(P)/FAD-dependent oxidoreductase [Candidatus Binatia bacterium]MDG2008644.1 NAD(P)/FAD-dependent oxidoreductase [Candidatus Binatia bacterium]
MDQPHEQFDAVIIGSGPNGLAAGVALAREGASVLVLEGASRLGGGADTREITLPGFRHDICSAAHPMGILSPFFRELPLEEHGLEWVKPGASVAHPLDDRPAGMLWRSLDRTVEELGSDGPRYRSLLEPLLANGQGLLKDALGPLSFPEDPVSFVRFGLRAMWPASLLAKTLFREETARALLAGCAGHSILPLSQPMTSALGVLFALTAHLEDWPVAKGGSDAITAALASLLRASGGELRTDHPVASARDLPPAKVYLFDTDPHQLARIAGDALPAGYRKRLQRYRFGPGVFKLDLAMDGPIPWKDPRCSEASTVHVGGTLDEVAASEAAMWRGDHSEKPFVLVVQQSNFDPTRAPQGSGTGYAYCHVPANSTEDMTGAIESQIERFAPGFRDRIQARHIMRTTDFAAMNPNYVGGAITGGVADLAQLFTRPVARLDPYSTPNPRIFICSASTPPGGGVHGMCGWHAARSAQGQLEKQTFQPFA